MAEFSAGYLSIAGTGNTFGAGAINLDCYGTLELVTPQDLSNITAINFNGGNLRLDAPMTALPSGMTAWNVTSGQLILGTAGDSVLGSSGLSVNLGGANSFGTIVGCWAYGTSDPGISRDRPERQRRSFGRGLAGFSKRRPVHECQWVD